MVNFVKQYETMIKNYVKIQYVQYVSTDTGYKKKIVNFDISIEIIQTQQGP